LGNTHNNRKRRILETAEETDSRPFWGLALLGFTAIYREGFEIVLFLQNLRLRAGNGIVLKGTSLGLGLTLIVAVLTLLAHRRLPYKKMLVCTGVLLGGILLIMVGRALRKCNRQDGCRQLGLVLVCRVGWDSGFLSFLMFKDLSRRAEPPFWLSAHTMRRSIFACGVRSVKQQVKALSSNFNSFFIK